MGSDNDVRVGAHISTAGGFPRAATRAAELGLDCMQHFTRNPRGTKQRRLGEREVSSHRERMREEGLGPVVMHTPYTVNLASPRERTAELSRRVVAEDLQRCRVLGSPYLVMHPGSPGDVGREVGLRRLVTGLDRALEEAEDALAAGVTLLLEFMAGQGSELGSTIDDMQEIIRLSRWADALGFCLDTCHSFARGYRIHEAEGLQDFLTQFDDALSLQRLQVVHVNDCMAECGSHRDRHAPLGAGEIGREGLRVILAHPAIRRLPLILEVPVQEEEEYCGEADLLRELADARSD